CSFTCAVARWRWWFLRGASAATCWWSKLDATRRAATGSDGGRRHSPRWKRDRVGAEHRYHHGADVAAHRHLDGPIRSDQSFRRHAASDDRALAGGNARRFHAVARYLSGFADGCLRDAPANDARCTALSRFDADLRAQSAWDTTSGHRPVTCSARSGYRRSDARRDAGEQ